MTSLPLIDTLIVNETEAEVVSGLKVEDAVTADRRRRRSSAEAPPT